MTKQVRREIAELLASIDRMEQAATELNHSHMCSPEEKRALELTFWERTGNVRRQASILRINVEVYEPEMQFQEEDSHD